MVVRNNLVLDEIGHELMSCVYLCFIPEQIREILLRNDDVEYEYSLVKIIYSFLVIDGNSYFNHFDSLINAYNSQIEMRDTYIQDDIIAYRMFEIISSELSIQNCLFSNLTSNYSLFEVTT